MNRKVSRALTIFSPLAFGIAVLSGNVQSSDRVFNKPGNVLISDQFNNRVIEINRAGYIVWSFGLGPSDFSPSSIIGVNDAQRVGEKTLMAGTGNPGGFGDCSPGPCLDNRVILVDREGHIEWQYGQFGVSGAGPNELNTPVQATWLPNAHVLITDQANARVIEVTPDRGIVWQYGATGGCNPITSLGDDCLNNPNSAELLENGHILIADENNSRVIEVNRDHHIVRSFTAGGTTNIVAFASRLKNGNTLITDSGNARIVEVDRGDNPVWSCSTNGDPLSNPSPLPTRALRLRNGSTIISDQFNNRVYIVDHNVPCNTLASYGLPLAMGSNTGFGTVQVRQGMNGPYDAKVNGDYTGITPPRDRDDDRDE
jgi:hypothetical protein